GGSLRSTTARHSPRRLAARRTLAQHHARHFSPGGPPPGGSLRSTYSAGIQQSLPPRDINRPNIVVNFATHMSLAFPPHAQPRVLITGGGGFLGRQVLAVLEQRGYQHVIAPRKADYDLTRSDHVSACLRDVRP